MAELKYPKNEINFYWSFFTNCNKVLDAGCGSGWFTKFKTKNAIGIDIDMKEYIRADIINLPFKSGIFDGVFASHVIEHIRTPEKSLKEFNRILKRNGKIVIRIPQGRYKYPTVDPTHRYIFTKESLETMVKKSGFYIIKILPRYQFRGMYKLPSKIVLPIAFFLAKFFEPTEILLFGKKK